VYHVGLIIQVQLFMHDIILSYSFKCKHNWFV